MKQTLCILFSLALYFNIFYVVNAQQRVSKPPQEKTSNTSQTGLFARIQLGAASSQCEWGNYWDLEGVAINLGVMGGIELVNKLYFHLDLQGNTTPNPNYNGFNAQPQSISQVHLGAGFTYYMVPQKSYIEATVGASKLFLVTEDFNTETDEEDGVSANFTISTGYEKVIEDFLGIGIKVFFQYGKYGAIIYDTDLLRDNYFDVTNSIVGLAATLSFGRL